MYEKLISCNLRNTFSFFAYKFIQDTKYYEQIGYLC